MLPKNIDKVVHNGLIKSYLPIPMMGLVNLVSLVGLVALMALLDLLALISLIASMTLMAFMTLIAFMALMALGRPESGLLIARIDLMVPMALLTLEGGGGAAVYFLGKFCILLGVILYILWAALIVTSPKDTTHTETTLQKI